jgi:adenylate kinase
MADYFKRLLLFGPPGAGKGTQAENVSGKLGIRHIDTGSIIRENIDEKTPLGLEAQSYVERGELVPDDVIIRLINDRLNRDDVKDGWLLDGFPRSPDQARALSEMGPSNTEPVQRVIFLEVPEETLVKRLSGRRICTKCRGVFNIATLPPEENELCALCGGELTTRPDDRPEAIHNRFRVYRESTEPIAEYYEKRGLLVRVDGTGEIEEVTDRVMDACKAD